MRISIIGSGYVGLATGVGFALKGNEVVLYDIDRDKLQSIAAGRLPVYEPGVEDGLRDMLKAERIRVTADFRDAVLGTDVSFICVPTPMKKDGSQDPSFVERASEGIGRQLKGKDAYHVVAVKSTVVPGTTERLVVPNLESFSGRKAGEGFGVCMNPEFLREGSALEDFLSPDRVVIGQLDSRSGDALEGLYRNFDCPVLRTRIMVAEMVKYAANAFLAAKVSFSNEIGNICKKLGMDVYEVMKGVGMDKRISPHFLRAGTGFGGSCFPKDVAALVSRSRLAGYEPSLLQEVLDVNGRQPLRLVDMLRSRLGGTKGKKVAILGLAFKPETDDVREAPSIRIVGELLRQGCQVRAYDPKASANFGRLFPGIEYCATPQKALAGADACLVLTEWPAFRELRDDDFKGMKERTIIEGRKALNPFKVTNYEGICW
jgi:UDPglucose 6-dehydrogenase